MLLGRASLLVSVPILLVLCLGSRSVSAELGNQNCDPNNHTIEFLRRFVPTWTTYAGMKWDFYCNYYIYTDLYNRVLLDGINPIRGVMQSFYQLPDGSRGHFTNDLWLLNKTSGLYFYYQSINVYLGGDVAAYGPYHNCFRQDGDPLYSPENFENVGVNFGRRLAVDAYINRNPSLGPVGHANKIEYFTWDENGTYSESTLFSFDSRTGKRYEELTCRYLPLGPYPLVSTPGAEDPNPPSPSTTTSASATTGSSSGTTSRGHGNGTGHGTGNGTGNGGHKREVPQKASRDSRFMGEALLELGRMSVPESALRSAR